MGYREDWFANNPGVQRSGCSGVWYRCSRCLGWFHKQDIDIDHRIPKRCGGTDDLFNLQAMCKHCNRSKGDGVTNVEIIQTIAATVATDGIEGITKLGGSVLSRKAKDALGIKYHR